MHMESYKGKVLNLPYKLNTYFIIFTGPGHTQARPG